MKEQLAAGLSEGQVAELVENDEVHGGRYSASRPCRLARASLSNRLTRSTTV
jgi:hypothetical protein